VIVVMDASAAYDLLTEARCAAKIEGADELIAPDLIVPELLNARWKAARSGAPVPDVSVTIEFLDRLRLLPALRYGRDASLLAERLDRPVYDCLYLAVAQREHGKLLTVDERMRAQLQSKRVASMLL
jgi:predicted nucleic acid-binding protein